nr:MAG TPA: hypothetical protein [Caudoviricetes sp.]
MPEWFNIPVHLLSREYWNIAMGQVLLLFQVSPKKCDQESVFIMLHSRSISKSHSIGFFNVNH